MTTTVKQDWARVVLRWNTGLELLVLLARVWMLMLLRGEWTVTHLLLPLMKYVVLVSV